MRRILITGGNGFLASHFVEELLVTTDWEIVLLDKFQDGGWPRLKEINCLNSPRVTTIDALLDLPLHPLKEIGQVDYIVHLGGRTGITDSICHPASYINSNIMGTFQMLELARKQKHLKRFIYFSTDEVYGRPTWRHPIKEHEACTPLTPYAASKLAASNLCLAWRNTYGVPVIVTVCMSLYGERQNPEKFIPYLVRSAIQQKKVQLYADEDGCPSLGDYLHAKDAVSAVVFLLTHGDLGETYNIARIKPHSNLEVLKQVEIATRMLLEYELVDPETVRPLFYPREGLDGSKLRSLGWRPTSRMNISVGRTARWLLKPENQKWLGIE